MNADKAKNIQGPETNPNKVKVRAVIQKQIESFLKSQGKGSWCLSSRSLPSTEWIAEKGWLEFCQKNSIPCMITGLEFNPNKPNYFQV